MRGVCTFCTFNNAGAIGLAPIMDETGARFDQINGPGACRLGAGRDEADVPPPE